MNARVHITYGCTHLNDYLFEHDISDIDGLKTRILKRIGNASSDRKTMSELNGLKRAIKEADTLEELYDAFKRTQRWTLVIITKEEWSNV